MKHGSSGGVLFQGRYRPARKWMEMRVKKSSAPWQLFLHVRYLSIIEESSASVTMRICSGHPAWDGRLPNGVSVSRVPTSFFLSLPSSHKVEPFLTRQCSDALQQPTAVAEAAVKSHSRRISSVVAVDAGHCRPTLDNRMR